jgi:hypothetical protein
VLKNNWRLRGVDLEAGEREVRIPGDHLALFLSLALERLGREGGAEEGRGALVGDSQASSSRPATPATRSQWLSPQSVSVRVGCASRVLADQLARSDRDASVRSVHVQKLAPQNQGTPRPLPPLPRRGKRPREMGGRVRTTELVQHHHRQVHFCFVLFGRQLVRASRHSHARAQSSHVFVAVFFCKVFNI